MFDLYKHINTDFCLVVQYDGKVSDPDLWNDDFLNYDYIGAAWTDGYVGNGGFTLRSKKLYDALVDMNVAHDTNSYQEHFNNSMIIV